MNIRDVWLAKTDSEVVTAFNQLNQYTSETQVIIRAEYARRSSEPRSATTSAMTSDESDAASAEGSTRQASLRAARDHLASLAVDQPPRGSNTGVSSSVQQRSSSSVGVLSSRPEPEGMAITYEYKVVPFIGQSKGNLSSNDVAKQLESVIAQHSRAGWEFWQLSDVNIEVQPGCIAGLFGASVQYVRFDQLIFRKKTPVDMRVTR